MLLYLRNRWSARFASSSVSAENLQATSLCVFHSREEQQLLEWRKIGDELAATVTGNFLTATDINYALGKVFTAASQNRIPARTAHTLAYLGQLLLMSLPYVKQGFAFRYKFEQ